MAFLFHTKRKVDIQAGSILSIKDI